MTGGDDTPQDDVELLDVGSRSRSSGTRQRWLRRWLPGLLVVAVVAGALVALISPGTKRHASGLPHPPPARVTPTPHRPAQHRAHRLPTTVNSAVSVTTLGHRLLGITQPADLFVRGDQVVVQIQFARGRIVRTTVPAVQSSGAVSFVVGRREVVIRPWDFVPGYVVPDFRPARALPGALSSGPALPGPDPQHVWLAAAANDRMVLVALDGRATGTSVAVPAGDSALQAQPDQAGYLLFRSGSRTDDVRPSGARPITGDPLVAAGARQWLTARCRPAGPCRASVIDRATGARRSVPITANDARAKYGVITPDGRTAALLRPDGLVVLFDCRSGRSRPLPLRVATSGWPPWQWLAWLPGGRWLFVVDSQGHVDAVQRGTGRVTDLTDKLGAVLPGVNELAVRGGRR